MKVSSSESWRPSGKRASLCLTFDNLGEAAEISRGIWPPGKSVGQHFTATSVFNRFLEELDGLRLTYFIEAVNVGIYPEQILSFRNAGHEIGLHSWGHENWGSLSLEEKRDNLQRSVAAFRSIGVELEGFRPPGGGGDSDSLALLRESGFKYCSPASKSSDVGEGEGVVLIPFEWQHVDAFMVDADLGDFRVANGFEKQPVTAGEWDQIVNRSFDFAVEHGRHLTLIFHPCVFGADESMWRVFSAFLRRVRACEDVWLTSCREVAERWQAYA